MPRNRAFNQDEVVHKAMITFWRQGYSATSLKDLEHATGLTTGSLYNSFNGKEQLFATCVRHYIESVVGKRINEHLVDENPLDGLRSYAQEIVRALGDTRYTGCLLLDAHRELAQLSPDVARIIRRGQRRLDKAIHGSFERAARDGTLGPHADTKATSRQYGLMLAGLLANNRRFGHADRKDALRAIDVFLQGLRQAGPAGESN
ncbi:MAG: TetR/AcrR family transcriptional regulator [Pseudomonadota bacterium]